MFSFKEYISFLFNSIRCIPHLIVFYFHKNKKVIEADIRRAYHKMEKPLIKPPVGLIYLFGIPQFRNVFYVRTKPFSYFLNILCPKKSTMQIQTKKIGEGFVVVHGVASMIGAESIGKNCTIYQQVTIGGITNHGAPIIADNVTIYAGAVVIGKIRIGNNVVIGANATVYKDIPDNSLILPGSSKIMKWFGTKGKSTLKEKLNNY